MTHLTGGRSYSPLTLWYDNKRTILALYASIAEIDSACLLKRLNPHAEFTNLR